jgi:hypothetical protein
MEGKRQSVLNLAADTEIPDHPKSDHVDRQVLRCQVLGCAAALPSNDISSGRTINYMHLSVNELQTSTAQRVLQNGSHASRGRTVPVATSLFLGIFNDNFSIP